MCAALTYGRIEFIQVEEAVKFCRLSSDYSENSFFAGHYVDYRPSYCQERWNRGEFQRKYFFLKATYAYIAENHLLQPESVVKVPKNEAVTLFYKNVTKSYKISQIRA